VSISGNKLLFKNADGIVIRDKVLDEDELKKIEIVLNDVPFQTETYKTVYQALGENGITLEKFLDLMRKSATELSPEEAKIIEAIRNSVPMPDANTPLQKVLNPAYVDSYFDGSFVKFNDGKISGCITTVDGAAGMTNPEEIFYGLRMDYVNTPFNPTDDSVVAIKFTSNDVDNIIIPYGDSMPNPVGGNVSNIDPVLLREIGFTSATNGQIIPEFYTDGVAMKDGAQMVRITSSGEEQVIGVFNEDLMKFVPVD